jgi:Family of unknown function (DUF5755)
MKKKCPPGVICIENITMGVLVICIIIALYFIYTILFKKNNNKTQNVSDTLSEERNYRRSNGAVGVGVGIIPQFPNLPYTNLIPPPVPGDVLLNPYSPPLRDERYLIPQVNLVPPGTVPINISTNVGAVDTSYRQVGILNPTNKPNKDNVLPLMGRPVFTNRDKWQYYTIGNQFNSVKLPIIVKGKSGLNEYGVDRLYNGDTIYIEGLNDVYRATIYDNDTIKYLPFI